MDYEILYKFLTYCFNSKSIFEDSDIINYIHRLQTTKPFTVKQWNHFTVYDSTGFQFYDSPSFSFAAISFNDLFVACCLVGERIYYWHVKEIQYKYTNFLFTPKYPVLANIVYNLYYDTDTFPSIYTWLLCANPSRPFKTDHIFSQTTILQVTTNDTNLLNLDLTMTLYNEPDTECLTSMELVDSKPWEIKPQHYEQYQMLYKLTAFRWNHIELYLRAFPFNHLILEKMLCDIKYPFLDEAYKFLVIAFETHNDALLKWINHRYQVDPKRSLQIKKLCYIG